jgi:hypothetical protein
MNVVTQNMAVRVTVKHVWYRERNSGTTPQDFKRRFADTNIITRQMRREDNYRQSNSESCEEEAMPLVPVQLCLLRLREVRKCLLPNNQAQAVTRFLFGSCSIPVSAGT